MKSGKFKTRNLILIIVLVLLIPITVAGVFLISTRFLKASEKTTIESLSIVNLTDNSFGIVWYTSQKSSSAVSYGSDKNNLSNTAIDERGEGDYTSHLVTVRNLKPQTQYSFTINADQSQNPLSVTTRATSSTVSVPKLFRGKYAVTEEALVVLTAIDSKGSELSDKVGSVLSSNGTWNIDLGALKNSASADVSDYKYLKVEIFQSKLVSRKFIEKDISDAGTLASGDIKQLSDTDNTSPATSVASENDRYLSNITSNSFTVNWSTNTAVIGKVKYGLDQNITNEIKDKSATMSHSLTVVDQANNGGTYYYQIYSKDSSITNLITFNKPKITDVPKTDPVSGKLIPIGAKSSGKVLMAKIIGKNGTSTSISVSTLVDGNWQLDLGNSKTLDYKSQFDYNDDDSIEIRALGSSASSQTFKIKDLKKNLVNIYFYFTSDFKNE